MIGLEQILKINKMSISDLARELGIARGNIYNWINGKRKIPKATLEKLVKMFKLPKEFFEKELTEVEKLEVERAMILKLLDETSFEIESNIINGAEVEEPVTMTYHDSALEYDLEEIDRKIYTKSINAQVIDRINKTLKNTSIDKDVLHINNSLCDIIDSSKVPLNILSNVLQAISIAYEIKKYDDINNFTRILVEDIKKNESYRQQKKKEIEELINSHDLEDLFS